MKTKKTTKNQRKHCLFRANELDLINEATKLLENSSREKLTFSHFLRNAAIQKAENITGRKIAR
jgi:hypothetical protein